MRKNKFTLFLLLLILIFALIQNFQIRNLKNRIKNIQETEKMFLMIPIQHHFNNYLDTIFSVSSYLTGLDVKYFYAVSKVESNHNPLALGDQGKSVGLFQIQNHEWKECLKNPLVNALTFAIILKGLEQKYGHITLALAIYNGGPRNPNLKYAQKVLKALENFEKGEK
jgi:soluble lytic murein transglycosylase-like protein